jgi:hypothetical protein
MAHDHLQLVNPDRDFLESDRASGDRGLTIETVSRTITQLASEQAIGLPSARRIVLRNSGALRQLNA